MKFGVTLFLALTVLAGWFYWTNIRPEQISTKCYITTKLPRQNENNLEWAFGKQWGLGEIGNSPRKPGYTAAQKMDWGWVYPDREWGDTELTHLGDLDRQNYLYDSCLKSAGIFGSTNPGIDWKTICPILIAFFGGGGVMALIFQEAIRDWLSRGNKKWEEKRQLAKDIMKLLDYAQGAGFGVPVGREDFEESARLVSLTMPIDEKISKKINQIVGLWSIYYSGNPENMRIPEHQYVQHMKDLTEKRNLIDKQVTELRKKVATWLK